MKRSLAVLISFCMLSAFANAQSGFIKKVANNVANDVRGASGGNSKNKQPEPSCACTGAEVVLDLEGSLKLQYSEISINVLDDGSLLVMDRFSQKYYTVKDGSTKGPFTENDPQVAPFLSSGGGDEDNSMARYSQYISKAGDKYKITFNGKSYGPFAEIRNFAVTKSKDKFAASVVENIVATEDEGKKMEEAIKNARSDQEKMELAMKFSQEMQQKMMAGGGPSAMTPKVITNIEGANFNMLTGGSYNSEMKYDDILVTKYNIITDLKGNKVIDIKPEHAAAKNVFVNSSNTKYAAYDHGTLNFSDGTSLSDLFNPRLMKSEGKIWLAYMYYSPGKNAIMQCRIPF